MLKFARAHIYQILLWVLILSYISYFATFSVLKLHHIYSQYFDLGIMHQTVFNSYQAIKTGDLGRILELTTPHGGTDQIKRMAIHNDMILFFLAPLYFIHSGPETLLVLQTVVIALGAWAVFQIAKHILKNELVSLAFAFAYLMYSPMQWANIFDFHAVTIATPAILYMFYFWLKGNKRLVLLFLVITLLTKEEVGMSLGMFGLYAGFYELATRLGDDRGRFLKLPAFIVGLSWAWSILSVFVIIRFFNHGEHFASGYYSDSIKNFGSYIFSLDTLKYIFSITGPLAFFVFVAPEFLFIASPELAINLLSSNVNLRALIYHYTSAIQPWIVIGSIYGVSRIFRGRIRESSTYITSVLILATIVFSSLQSPLPYSRDRYVDPWLYDRGGEYVVVKKWVDRLSSDKLKVSTTDEIAPFFTNRRYFYIFSHDYTAADYVIVSLGNIHYSFRNDVTIPAYEELKSDPNFTKVDEGAGYEVYKRNML